MLPVVVLFEGWRAPFLLLAQPVVRHAVGRRRRQLAVFCGVTIIENLTLLRLTSHVGGMFGLQVAFQGCDLAIDRV